MTYEVNLPNARRVSEFVAVANKYDSPIRAISGIYTANAKSIMGMLTLDLSASISVSVEDEDADRFAEDIVDFLKK